MVRGDERNEGGAGGVVANHKHDLAPPRFTCPACGLTSHNPNDAKEGYCGRCHAFTGRR